ncbi:hypothetical protein vBAspALolek_01 [Aeromonas phage vB_AspA_Lolek]|nr:hypothetical protein vBAspALolek_01 [Aeromonas phage vB_AspA_Lolek]
MVSIGERACLSCLFVLPYRAYLCCLLRPPYVCLGALLYTYCIYRYLYLIPMLLPPVRCKGHII